MADKDLMYYVPPELRGPLSEAGRVGYNILDNIIGFDDEYDTTGELLARSLRENPVGTAKGMASGAYEGLKGAVSDPVGTLEGMGSEVLAALSRLREPLPEDASREEIAQRTSDLGILASVVPVGRLAKAGGESMVDAAFVDQYYRKKDRTPAVDIDRFAGRRLFTPSDVEADMMRSNPTPAEQMYLETLKDPRRTFEMPFYDYEGNLVETRPMTSLNWGPEHIGELRPNALKDWSIGPSSELPPDSLGQADIIQKTIEYSDALPASDVETILRHEIQHADLSEAGVPIEAVGSNVGLTGYLKDVAEEGPFKEATKNLTAREMYSLNPGEMLARIAHGDLTTEERLTALEVLNPYLASGNLSERAKKALQTMLFSETNPIGRKAGEFRDLVRDYPSDGSMSDRLVRGIASYLPEDYVDFHTEVPMDISKNRVYAPDYKAATK